MKFAYFSPAWNKPGMTPAQRYEQLWRSLGAIRIIEVFLTTLLQLEAHDFGRVARANCIELIIR